MSVTLIKILGIIAFAAVFFIIPALVVIYIVRIARKTSVDQGLCRNCGYDLTIPPYQGRNEGGPNAAVSPYQEGIQGGPNEDKCPQCGRPFVRDEEGMPFS